MASVYPTFLRRNVRVANLGEQRSDRTGVAGRFRSLDGGVLATAMVERATDRRDDSGGESAPRSRVDTTKASSGPRWRAYLSALGPGLVTGASDDDPSGIATYAQAGAQF